MLVTVAHGLLRRLGPAPEQAPWTRDQEQKLKTHDSELRTLEGAMFRHLIAWSLAGIVSVGCGGGNRSGSRDLADRTEAAYRANNRGVALLEKFAHEEAAGAFREALDLDPSLGLARINLPIALFYAGRNEEAAERALAARDRHPDAPQPAYLLGLIARAGNEPDEGIAAVRRGPAGAAA